MHNYYRLFETHPHFMKKFKPFENLKLEDLVYNKRLAAHAATVMSAIDSYIENLDDVTVVVEMLKATGHNHQGRGITVEDFQVSNDYLKLCVEIEISLGQGISITKGKQKHISNFWKCCKF